MAGYIFSLNNLNSLSDSIKNGIYSTILNIPKNRIWGAHHEGTFGDYITMKEGDNIYFFHERKLYGIGELVNIKGDCKHLNFPEADFPYEYNHASLKNRIIVNNLHGKKHRMVCTFKGAPHFFKNGVDMDDVLSSNPERFKMLRAFWKLSFIKIDDEENKALIDVILKNNEASLVTKEGIFMEKENTHEKIADLVDDKFIVKSENILASCSNNDGSVRHEMALETGILDYISNNKTNKFGEWDYLSHQVIASPFKPIDYMDKMDIFGYKYIYGFQTISKYLMIEIKKDSASSEDINQAMKYVDWINQEYSFGDYNMIQAFLVAFEFPTDVIEQRNKIAHRNFVKGRRPLISMEWDNLKLIRYHFDSHNKKLTFTEVN
ncbi:hypothetical protein [Lentibacillus sp. CBA3610]|uniref:hypothetical protein n=1 Tax=Lentibacillus sp. CBA3610 TaxID=2518176 RepID=UPI0015962E7C|nr:hypothetical protein [Lentibacillus sp. CBA3610]QKY68709.1 hypothetical protein Len3610_02910 [Lentibacillus sp. CBA3610]